jgi:hypothetical protein
VRINELSDRGDSTYRDEFSLPELRFTEDFTPFLPTRICRTAYKSERTNTRRPEWCDPDAERAAARDGFSRGSLGRLRLRNGHDDFAPLIQTGRLAMTEHIVDVDSSEDSQAKSAVATATVDTGLIIREVLNRLGTPNSLYRVTATKVYDKHFRVNVYCQRPTDDAFRPVVMTDSFFVELGDNGLTSQPPIQHRYGQATVAV